MSRMAKKPLSIPKGVEVKVEGNVVKIKGPKGSIERKFLPIVKLNVEDNNIWVKASDDNKVLKTQEGEVKMFLGTYWSLINSMLIGVTKGFTKELEIIGIGYRAQLQGSKLVMQLGYSHPVEYVPYSGVVLEVPAPNKIVVKGIDKEKVGQTAAEIRSKRLPNSYSGKGVRYANEVVKLKEGKKA